MTTIAIISFVILLLSLLFTGFIEKMSKYPKGSKLLSVNSLDVYTNEDPDMEDPEPTVLYSTKL